MRLAIIWSILVGSILGYFIPFALVICTCLGILFLIADTIVMGFGGKGRSLHDRIANTHVVLGSYSR